jgi:hypothetical protein
MLVICHPLTAQAQSAPIVRTQSGDVQGTAAILQSGTQGAWAEIHVCAGGYGRVFLRTAVAQTPQMGIECTLAAWTLAKRSTMLVQSNGRCRGAVSSSRRRPCGGRSRHGRP